MQLDSKHGLSPDVEVQRMYRRTDALLEKSRLTNTHITSLEKRFTLYSALIGAGVVALIFQNFIGG